MGQSFDLEPAMTPRSKYGFQRIVFAVFVVTIGWLATARATPEIPDVAMTTPSPPTDQCALRQAAPGIHLLGKWLCRACRFP